MKIEKCINKLPEQNEISWTKQEKTWELHSIHEDVGLIPCLTQWVKNPVLLWLWCRPAAAAPVWPLAQELPHAMGASLIRKKKRQNLNCYPVLKLWGRRPWSLILGKIQGSSVGSQDNVAPLCWRRGIRGNQVDSFFIPYILIPTCTTR